MKKSNRYMMVGCCLGLLLFLVSCANTSDVPNADTNASESIVASTSAMDIDSSAQTEPESVPASESDTVEATAPETIPETETEAPANRTVASLKEYFFGEKNLSCSGEHDNSTCDCILDPDSVEPYERTELVGKMYDIRLTPELLEFNGAINPAGGGMGYVHCADSGSDGVQNEKLYVYLESEYTDLVLVFGTFFGNTEDFRLAVENGSYFKALLVGAVNVESRLRSYYVLTDEDQETTEGPLGAPYTETVVLSTGYIDYILKEPDEIKLTFHILPEDSSSSEIYRDFLRQFGIPPF